MFKVAFMLFAAGGAVACAPTTPLPLNADPERLAAHVRHIVAHGPRDATHAENLAVVADDVAATLRTHGARVSEQAFDVDGRRYRNVIGTLGPDTRERIVVGAHYDTDGPYPGADDNASGVAGLMELARLLSQTTLATRVDLVAFTLEEMPFFLTDSMGSYVYASALRTDGVPVRAMISLEMIGYFRDEPGSQAFPSRAFRLFYPSAGNFIAVVTRWQDVRLTLRIRALMRRGTALPVYSFAGPAGMPGISWSDHVSFWRTGYRAVMVTDTAFYRNPHYHAATDTPEKLDYGRMARVIDGVANAVRELAK